MTHQVLSDSFGDGTRKGHPNTHRPGPEIRPRKRAPCATDKEGNSRGDGRGGTTLPLVFPNPKKDRSWRLIINLKPLTKGYVRPTHFRMETLAIVIPNLAKGMRASSVNLKNAYFYFPVEITSQRFLEFSYKERNYNFVSLPFGLSTSPRVFTRVAGAVVADLRRSVVTLYANLDD
ncbi:reverse transcriptase [Apostichopus japonicus]|uniref:Reverse transcriptase n=1 Tax=Stichopus japonicus TaxID=307972 RepID=A0A2G8KJ27_STIJA|nr:reverse transcriptase [Apostichopus japonicus]